MEELFLKNIREKTNIKPGDRILVAVSGGMDSVLLFYLLKKYRIDLGIQLEVAHINHMLRGKESDLDQVFVESLAKEWSIPCHTTKIDVETISKKNKWSIEEGARKLRYEYLNQLKDIRGCKKIAVAHHHKDQAETILMHLIRGTGSEGLRGMAFDKDGIIRPFLNIGKEEIEKYVKTIRMEYRTDKSNFQTKHTRNKIRIKLIPYLKKYNPQVENNLVKAGQIIGDDSNFIETEVDKYYKKYVIENKGYFNFDKSILKLHKAIRRRIMIKGYKQLSKKYLEYRYVEEMDKYLLKPQNNKLGLPNEISLYKSDNGFILDMRSKFIKSDESKNIEVLLEGPGRYDFQGKKLVLEAIEKPVNPGVYTNRGAREGYVDYNKIGWPLVARNRKPGDLFQVVGNDIGRKLKKLFIDRGIDRETRDILPLIISSDGNIVFIPEIGVSELFKIDYSTTRILHFYYR